MSKKSNAPRLRLRHWGVRNWRNFQRAEFPVSDRIFLVGPNASGKSNLLDSLRFLRDVVSVGGGFQEAVRSRQGVSAIRCLAARAKPAVEIEVELGTLDGDEPVWRYELAFKQDKSSKPLITKEKVTKNGEPILRRPLPDDEDDPERLRQTFLEQVTANREYRPIAEFLRSIEYLHLVPQLVRDPDRSVGKSNDPYGGDFLQRVAKIPDKTRKARLRKILDALKIAIPQVTELHLERDDRGVPHLRGRYQHWRLQGAWQNEEQFSDGTLRLIGLLWAVLSGGGPILLEEPELSLHGEIVKHLPRILARMSRDGRQVLLSTHSADLLTDGGIGLDEVLLLFPEGEEGTTVRLAADDAEARALLDGGLRFSDVVIRRTAPSSSNQLSLFEP